MLCGVVWCCVVSCHIMLCCAILCCVVSCCIVCVLTGPDTKPRNPLSQNFLAWGWPNWWSQRQALGFSLNIPLSLAPLSSLFKGALAGFACIWEISLVCLYVHFPGLIYLLFLQKDNLGSARHQLLSLTTLECLYNVQEALYLSNWFFPG